MMRPHWIAIAVCMGLAACGKTEDPKPPGMPEGYVRVNPAFGVRMAGLSEVEDRQLAPVVEFRAAGDYAMYPLTTDCEGNFQRGAGLVFAADGTVREQVPEQAPETVSSSPQFGPVIDRICTPSRAALAAVKNDATHWRTRFGLLEIRGDRGEQAVTLKRRAVASGSLLAFAGGYRVGDFDHLLLHEQDMGTSCPGGEYTVLTVSRAGVESSATFGTCVEGEPVVRVIEGALEMAMPGSNGPVPYRFANGAIEAGDAASELDDDGYDPTAAGESDAFASAADAATAANAAAEESREAAAGADFERTMQGWANACETASRRVTTPAGSVVGLSADEARRYCNCAWQRASGEEGALARRNDLNTQPVSALFPQAHAACLQSLM